MSKSFSRAAVVLNPRKDYQSLLDGIAKHLERENVSLSRISLPHDLPDLTVCEIPEPEEVDFVIALGGDGTLLYTARLFAKMDVPIIAVNLGTFGFITEICRDEIYSSLDLLFKGDYEIENRIMLEVSVRRDDVDIATFYPLNEAVIGRKEITRLLTMPAKINNEYLCTYKADGLIISTPTGSTGYSLSANGPILLPKLENFIINPICPHSLASRPFILSKDDVVEISFSGSDIFPILTIDVQVGMELNPGDRVIIKKAPYLTKLLLSSKRTFFQVLRDKLGWVDK